MHKNRICQLVSIIVGLVLVAGGIIIWFVVDDAIHNTVYKATRALPDNGLDSSINPWTRFLTNKGDPDNQRDYVFNVYNLTNPEDFLAGHNPIYQEVGPYIYKSLFENLDVHLFDDDNKVSYKYWKNYEQKVPIPEGYRDANADTIYHFNVAYQAVVNQLGSETNIGVIITLGILDQFWHSMLAQNATLNNAAAGVTTIKRICMALQQNMQAGKTLPHVCSDVWFQAPTSETDYFPIGNATTINVQQCVGLLNPQTPGNYTFFSKNPQQLLTLLQAATGVQAAAQIVMTSYAQDMGIGQADSLAILKYLGMLLKVTVMGKYFGQFIGCDTCNLAPGSIDSLYAQWAIKGGYLGTSIINIDTSSGLSTAPEFGVMINQSLPIASAKILMNNQSKPFNLRTPTGLVGFLQTVQTGKFDVINAATGLDQAQAIAVVQYIQKFAQTITVPFLKAKSVGLVQKHTVTQFLFNMTDPLLQMLFKDEPSKWNSNMVTTILDKDVANATITPDISWTGKSNTDLVLAPITYKGKEYVPYRSNITVTGNAPEQLGPFLLAEHDDPEVHVFSGDFIRNLHLTKVESGALSGLPYYRYRIHPETWQPNEEYFQSIPYLLNISSVTGKPVFITRPRFQGLAPAYFAKSGLSNFIYDSPDNDVYVDYEPRTGKAINGRYSIQINSYIPPCDTFSPSFVTSKVTCDVIHPLFWGKNEVIAKPNQIDAILLAYKIDAVRYALTILLIAGGGFLILGAVGLFLFEHVKEKIL